MGANKKGSCQHFVRPWDVLKIVRYSSAVNDFLETL